MSWTDESGNPECRCGHVWAQHWPARCGGESRCRVEDCGECVGFEERPARWAEPFDLEEAREAEWRQRA